jgi:hypothetical protein
MLASVNTLVLTGMEANTVRVEVDILNGLLTLDNSEYANIIVSLLIIGLIIDLSVYLTKQKKHTGRWTIDYSNLAVWVIGSMFIMSYATYVFRSEISAATLISLWALLPCYVLLRSLKKA